MKLHAILSFLATATSISALPTAAEGALEPRRVINHDALWPLPESLPNDAIGNAIRRFEPYMHRAHGCQVMTAVNSAGDTSGGLQDTGSPSGGCAYTNRQQTYVRTTWHRGRYAIMYSWYWPKDQPIPGNSAGGHRHDWENVVVWLNNPAVPNPTIIGAAASGHGNYRKTTNPQRNGDRVKVEYFTEFPYNHSLQFTNTQGWGYSKVHWNNLSGAARSALEWTNFGKATVPFKDGTFLGNLDKAWI